MKFSLFVKIPVRSSVLAMEQIKVFDFIFILRKKQNLAKRGVGGIMREIRNTCVHAPYNIVSRRFS